MNGENGQSADKSATLDTLTATEIAHEPRFSSNFARETELPTRAKLRSLPPLQRNRFLIICAGAVATAILIFVGVSIPHAKNTEKKKSTISDQIKMDGEKSADDESLLPITDSGRPPAPDAHKGFLNERDLERTVKRSTASSSRASTNERETLGSIAPFGEQAWEAPAYQTGANSPAIGTAKPELNSLDKSSLIYVTKNSSNPSGVLPSADGFEPRIGLRLPTGMRLRARLESAASSAVRTPVLAVIEYNYEQEGEILIPAGTKAVGHLRGANRSGYLDIQFDSLLMPDGEALTIEAAATALDLRPLKGKVEGKNTGRNALVRSLSGIGQAGSLLLGQNNPNQPLNESDLIRERLSSNIGEASDEELSRLAVNQSIVITVAAGTPIYVVLEGAPKPTPLAKPSDARSTSEMSAKNHQLHQLSELQEEVNSFRGDTPTQ